jgi:peptidoglycan/xylan/chitin deacetylase (PgdA/CDA1 family)
MHGSALTIVIAVLLPVACAAASRFLVGQSAVTAGIGLAVFGVGCLLLPWASFPWSGIAAGALIGLGMGPLLDLHSLLRWRAVSGIFGGGEPLVLLRLSVGVEWAVALAFAYGALAFAVLLAEGRVPHRAAWPRALSAGGVGLVLSALAVFWVGSTSPSVEWFGQLTFHGPRSVNQVAITFDDGPNGDTTLAIARILEERGARGTFFEVGKAVVKQPEVARALIGAGHVVGNHSYYHDAWRYLDPRYPELDRTQTAIATNTGVCPALFRPPHGTHTPFMSAVVEDHGMQLVTWDVSARDWVEDDAARLARNVLEKVRPGSIILLHDGIDGLPGAGRSVVVEALPLILDGLAAKGLTAVTLDRLLGVPAYLPSADCH